MNWILAVFAGAALGAFFYGGLWWTVSRGTKSSIPAAWFFSSLFVRIGVIVVFFLLVGGSHWDRLLACLVGFEIARFAITWITRSSPTTPPRRIRGADHAA